MSGAPNCEMVSPDDQDATVHSTSPSALGAKGTAMTSADTVDARGAPPVDVERAARAHPIEAEQALSAWVEEREKQGVWTSPAGWWYAGWHARDAEFDRLRQAKEEAEQTIADQDGELKFERQRAAEKEQLAVEWHVKATQHAVDTARVERENAALQRRLAALTEIATVAVHRLLNGCRACRDERMFVHTCLPRNDLLDRLAGLDADAQEQER